MLPLYLDEDSMDQALVRSLRARGADVLTELKSEPSTNDIRVIIVTATGEEGREYVLSLGADEYFTKPFSPTALLRTVERVLESPSEPSPAGS